MTAYTLLQTLESFNKRMAELNKALDMKLISIDEYISQRKDLEAKLPKID
jgi:hypothetical protein